MSAVKKLPRWDDDPQNGTPECCIHWRGGHDVERFRFWIGHPDRLRVEQEDGRWWLVDLWTGERQALRGGCLVVVERGGEGGCHMSCQMVKDLLYLLNKRYGRMSDSEARAWAEKEATEEDLRREKAKVRWLCRHLAFRDAGEPFPQCRRSAESWEVLADLYGNGR